MANSHRYRITLKLMRQQMYLAELGILCPPACTISRVYQCFKEPGVLSIIDKHHMEKQIFMLLNQCCISYKLLCSKFSLQ